MRLRRRENRGSPETIIALIDVVFFLLVFFLLIGRMDATAPFSVTPPFALSGAEMPGGGATISVALDGALALNGTERSRTDIIAGIGALLARSPDLLVRVNAHRGAELRHILPLVAEMEAMGARDVVLVVTPEGP